MDRLLFGVILLASLILLGTSAIVSQTLTFQSTVTFTAEKQSPTGDYLTEFRLYDTPTGGTPLWSEKRFIYIEKGSYEVQLGQFNPINIRSDKSYWLEVDVKDLSHPSSRVEVKKSGSLLRVKTPESENGLRYMDASKVSVNNKVKNLENISNRNKNYKKNIDYFESGSTGSGLDIEKPTFTDFKVISGYRDDEKEISVVSDNSKAVESCIKRFRSRYATLSGKVEVNFSIHPDGHVIPESIKIIKTDIHDPRIIKCIKKNISRFKNFRTIAGELGEYSITQKYVF